MAGVPSRRDLAKYSVNREGWEVIRQSLYDFQAYAAAGQSTLNFFAVPVGQSSKTLSDTNMVLAGILPANIEFLVQSIEVLFYPTVPAVTAQNPAVFGAQAVAAAVNDVALVNRTGNLTFTIGSKPYLQEAPLGRLPAKTHLNVQAALSDVSTAGASFQSRIAYAYSAGRPYLISPVDLWLTSTQNFSVALNWPEGVQAITNAGRIGVILDGLQYRRSQ